MLIIFDEIKNIILKLFDIFNVYTRIIIFYTQNTFFQIVHMENNNLFHFFRNNNIIELCNKIHLIIKIDKPSSFFTQNHVSYVMISK